jgi:hypothetical protein
MPATKAPKEKLTLRDGVDLYLAINQWIEDNVDAVELNGGALPDDLAALLDQVDAATAERVDALAFKIDEFAGYAESAKATADRAARRRRVWENAIAAMKAYGLFQVQRAGVDRLRGVTATLRIQKNSAPSTVLALTDEQLLEICDEDARNLLAPAKPGYKAHALSPFISVTRMAVVDRKALAAAYEARRDELVRESELLGVDDIPDDVMARLHGSDSPAHPDDVKGALADIRRNYVTDVPRVRIPGCAVREKLSSSN